MGCGGSKRNVVNGTIRYNGQPVNGVLLRLYPTSGEKIDISIPVSQEGTFRTSDIPPGEYKVVVEAPPSRPQENSMPSLKGLDPAKAEEMKQKLQQAKVQETPTIRFPDKYKNIMSTELKCTIIQGNQPLNLELKD
jgi:hypothetical protein